MKLNRQQKKWLGGLANTLLAGAILSGLDLLASPAGEFHWKLIGTSLLWNLKSYLKDHPPDEMLTETTTTTTETTTTPTSVIQTEVKETVKTPQ